MNEKEKFWNKVAENQPKEIKELIEREKGVEPTPEMMKEVYTDVCNDVEEVLDKLKPIYVDRW